jgi:hypothetical protein
MEQLEFENNRSFTERPEPKYADRTTLNPSVKVTDFATDNVDPSDVMRFTEAVPIALKSPPHSMIEPARMEPCVLMFSAQER